MISGIQCPCLILFVINLIFLCFFQLVFAQGLLKSFFSSFSIVMPAALSIPHAVIMENIWSHSSFVVGKLKSFSKGLLIKFFSMTPIHTTPISHVQFFIHSTFKPPRPNFHFHLCQGVSSTKYFYWAFFTKIVSISVKLKHTHLFRWA